MAMTDLGGFLEGGDGPLAARHEFAPAAGDEVEDALLARLRQADVGPRAEAEVAGAPVQLDALRPGLGELAAGRALDQQGEPPGAAPVSIPSRLPDGGDEARGKSVGAAAHGVFDAGISDGYQIPGPARIGVEGSPAERIGAGSDMGWISEPGP